MLPSIKPMLATFAKPFDSQNYSFEIKWDGYRCLAYLDSNTNLQSRSAKDLTITFPELRETHKKFKAPGAILDGEIIALRNGKPDFFELQKRGHMTKSLNINAMMKKIPVVYVIFDLLFMNYEPVYNEPIETRRALLKENLVYSDELILTDFVCEKGKKYFDSVTALGLEGIVAKKIGSSYFPGKRSKAWLKIKKRKTSPFVVCGYEVDKHKNPCSLIIGAYISDNFHCFGSVSSGLINQMAKEMDKISTPICPFGAKEQENIIWVKPIVVCEIEYLEFTDSFHLRDPVFKNFCPQLRPDDCQF